MTRSYLALSLLAALLLTPTLASAQDICEDVNTLSNGWNEVANLVHQYGDQLDTLPEADAAALVEGIAALSEATGMLIGLLETGDETEQTLAAAISVHAVLLVDLSETNNEIVASVDGMVDSLDLVTDYCDTVTDEMVEEEAVVE